MEYNPIQIKNLVRRGLRWLVDPEPDRAENSKVREYFDHQCAYCGTVVVGQHGDMDHLVPAALGGANALANRVLSCKPCNTQKRDQDWEAFIAAKCRDSRTLDDRSQRIRAWVELNGGHPVLDPDVHAVLAAESKRLTSEYDEACRRIRLVAARAR